MTREQYEKFVDLVVRLSPENLACDGECTDAQIAQRHRDIWREWRTLEKEVGRTVSLEEVEIHSFLKSTSDFIEWFR